jgi:hypothetical protein
MEIVGATFWGGSDSSAIYFIISVFNMLYNNTMAVRTKYLVDVS